MFWMLSSGYGNPRGWLCCLSLQSDSPLGAKVALITSCVSALSFLEALWLFEDMINRRNFRRLLRGLRWCRTGGGASYLEAQGSTGDHVLPNQRQKPWCCVVWVLKKHRVLPCTLGFCTDGGLGWLLVWLTMVGFVEIVYAPRHSKDMKAFVSILYVCK